MRALSGAGGGLAAGEASRPHLSKVSGQLSRMRRGGGDAREHQLAHKHNKRRLSDGGGALLVQAHRVHASGPAERHGQALRRCQHAASHAVVHAARRPRDQASA